MAQTYAKPAKVTGIMRSAAFRRGVKEAVAGLPMAKDMTLKSDGREVWNYERGRLFGAALRAELVTVNGPLYTKTGTATDSAIIAFSKAYREGCFT